MDITINIMAIAFLTLLGIVALLFFKDEPVAAPPNPVILSKREDPTFPLQKKIATLEEKIKNLEEILKTAQEELNQTREREKTVLREKSQVVFDSQQYEKFREEHKILKQELAKKEEILEKEISLRRQHADQLLQARQETEGLKKRANEAEDSCRRSQTAIEALAKELKDVKKTLEDKQRIVQELHENKSGGEWISRLEFEKVEKELREKEALIQKLLSARKDAS